jgi:hypothetical protein
MSLCAAAEETTLAQYRALVVMASRGPQRLVDLAGALGVAPSTAGGCATGWSARAWPGGTGALGPAGGAGGDHPGRAGGG